MMNYRVTDHFETRLKERSNYDLETLANEIRKRDVINLTKDSKELNWFPQLKKEFIKYPNSTLSVIESLGMVIVTNRGSVITTYQL